MLPIRALNWGCLALCFRLRQILGRPAAFNSEESS